MKMKLVSVLLTVSLLLTACGSSNTASVDTSSVEPTASGEVATSVPTQTDTVSSVDVDEGLFDVEITIPASFMEGNTQEDLDTAVEENGYKSATLNDDGSVTYVMSKQQHKKLMQEMRDSFNTALDELVGSEDYPNITDIKVNDDFTDFTVTTTSTELGLAEAVSVWGFYLYGGMYGAFNGTPADNVSVTFVNADTGEVISTSNSSDME